LPADLSGGPAAQAFADRIGEADAFVVVTPEYNHGYPGPLKVAIDTVVEQWQAKPVGFVSYGGVSGGLRAVEQLRGVFAELHAVTVREAVSFAHVWDRFDDDGALREPRRAEAAADRLLAQLGWWARALRRARALEPYAG
jgi:NAD(P)H-dependent FMN reductase